MQSYTYNIVAQNKTRWQTEKQKQNNILKQKTTKTTKKSKNQKLKWETEIHFFFNNPKH